MYLQELVESMVTKMVAVRSFENPRSLLIDPDGNLLVADAGNNAIRLITPAGEASTVVEQHEKFAPSTEATILEANLYIPFGLAYSSRR